MSAAKPLPAPEVEFIDPREFADFKRAMRITGQNRSYIYDHQDDPENPFPKPVAFVGRRQFWRCEQLFEWNDRQVQLAEKAGPKKPN